MKKSKIVVLICVVWSVTYIVSCHTLSGQPVIKKVEVIPSTIEKGESAVIKAVIKDKHHLVRYVEGIIKEDPRIKLRLRDDGIAPDGKANDGIWTLKVDVPEEAIPGEFILEVTAYKKDGSPLKIRDKRTGIIMLREEVRVEIVENK